MTRRLFISFSSGETSAYMTQWLLRHVRHLYDEIVIGMANTSRENEESLIFADKCDRLLFQPLGGKLVWLEAVQHHGKRKAAGFRQVTFETACRNGDVFEDMIKKYGIPNPSYKHCTRDLKLAPMHAYCASIGWPVGSYDTAIGIRADEIDRMSPDAEKYRLIYPLIKPHPTVKNQVNAYWNAQSFRLRLTGYGDNCQGCFKKSDRKILTLIKEDRKPFEWLALMVEKYGLHGAEFRKALNDPNFVLPDGYNRVFFRKMRSTADMIAYYESVKDTFVSAGDDRVQYDATFDTGGGCEESCEIYSEEDMRAVFPKEITLFEGND